MRLDQRPLLVRQLVAFHEWRPPCRHGSVCEFGVFRQSLDADWANDADGNSDLSWTYLHQAGRRDATTNLAHFRFRDQSPSLGRWVSADPDHYGDGANLYSFVGENPAVYIDRYGLQRWYEGWGTTIAVAVGGYGSGAAGSVWAAAGEGALDGTAAWTDGALPGEYFADHGYYDPSDSVLGVSNTMGTVSALAWSTAFLLPAGPAGQVTRWGSPITEGSWVMTGAATWRNWIMSGKVLTNPYNYSVMVGATTKWPSGWEFWKGFIGQRIVTILPGGGTGSPHLP
ncbi:RHS repeat-associated core domain-containing protein [Fontivita pretiosa]|uniref:RHS repeat-associated core domain-containing protein n=1 Tax=Fontivita pretiosa TaxID=2989684 RepID=UPI003D1809B5